MNKYSCQCSVMKYSVEQKLFIYCISVQHSSWRKCCRKFHRKYPDSTVLHKATIHNIVTKLCSMGSVPDQKKYRKRHVDDISVQLKASPKKSLHILALQCGLAKSTARVGTKLLKLWPCKTIVYIVFCLQIKTQEFSTVVGFRNQYSMDLLTQNLHFILTRCKSL
jgi:hypothetical protein